MKAVVYSEYGPPDVLRLVEIEKPSPSAGEVLIAVRAATVTTGDVNMRGFTFVPPGFGPLPRLMFGVRRPRKAILGTEVAGEVAAVGEGVTAFRVGDRVFGIDSKTIGAYAEFVCRPADGPLAIMPQTLSFEEAAALPGGAGTALYFLRDLGDIQRGHRLLVNGASGSVGSYAVQLGQHFGAVVTGVCSTRNVALVRSWGADEVLDYTREDAASRSETYDLVLDTVRGSSFSRFKDALREGGRYLAVAGGPGAAVRMAWTSLSGSKKVKFGSPAESKEALEELKALVDEGALRPYIDRRFTLQETAEAHRYVDTGRKRGNVVITVSTQQMTEN